MFSLLLKDLISDIYLGEEVYNNQNNHKPNNWNRRADEALVDRANHVNWVRGNLNSSIKVQMTKIYIPVSSLQI